MINIITKLVFFSFIAFHSNYSFGVTPLKSLIDQKIQAKSDFFKSDPLRDLTAARLIISKEKYSHFIDALSIYKVLVAQSLNLKTTCDSTIKTTYITIWQKMQAMRTVMMSFQNYGIMLTSSAIASYFRAQTKTEEDYKRMMSSLIHNSCSSNISFLAPDNLKKKIFSQWNLYFKLPTVDGNPLFSSNVNFMNSIDKTIDNELYLTIELFKSFCSWGNDVDNPRFMAALLKNPVVYTIFSKILNDTKLVKNRNSELVRDIQHDNGFKLKCTGFICRETESDNFVKSFPRMLGTANIKDELDRLYCSTFSKMKVKEHVNNSDLYNESIRNRSQYYDNFLGSQFIALVTKLPDLIVKSGKLYPLQGLFKNSIDVLMNRWADKQLNVFKNNFYLEESLSLELVDSSYYFIKSLPVFKVMFDLNLGEFDRASVIVGKIQSTFHLRVHKNLLRWIHNDNVSTYLSEESDSITRLLAVISPQIIKQQKNLKFKPLSKSAMKIVAKELIYEIAMYSGNYFKNYDNELVNMEVNVNYAPYALQYLYYRHSVETKSGSKILYKE